MICVSSYIVIALPAVGGAIGGVVIVGSGGGIIVIVFVIFYKKKDKKSGKQCVYMSRWKPNPLYMYMYPKFVTPA